MTEPLVRIDRLSKTFRSHGSVVHAVDQVSLTIGKGEVLGLVGESGSGKSTLGKLLIGLHDKDGGSVEVAGQRLPRAYRRRDFQQQARVIQMIFQDPSSCLNPRMTVSEILSEPLSLLGGRDRSGKVIRHWLERVNLPMSVLQRYPHELSGGQKQRIGIARALIMEPSLLVCDEPISALDVSVQAQVVNLLRGLQKELGLTLLFIAHDLAMVRYISDRIAVMYRGQLMELGPADTLVADPRHPYSQLLLAASPVADPAVKTLQRVELEQKNPVPEGGGSGCQFAHRCPRVMPVCHQQRPDLMPLTGSNDRNRLAACHALQSESSVVSI